MNDEQKIAALEQRIRDLEQEGKALAAARETAENRATINEALQGVRFARGAEETAKRWLMSNAKRLPDGRLTVEGHPLSDWVRHELPTNYGFFLSRTKEEPLTLEMIRPGMSDEERAALSKRLSRLAS